MIAVLTADLINSQNSHADKWLPKLKSLLSLWGNTPETWEVYRGDVFQYKCSVDDVLLKAILIKSLVKSFENLDIRIAIGVGNENFVSDKITESNGTAYVNSGKLLKELKELGRNFAIKTPNEEIDRDLNILFKWLSLDFDNWTPYSAEIVHIFAKDSSLNQEQVAQKLAISQSSVSQRLKRANFDLIWETNKYFKEKIAQL